VPVDTIPLRLLNQGRSNSARTAYRVRDASGRWVGTDYKTYAAEVRQAARALIALGFEAGDKVCILGFNRPEWVIADVGAMMAGGVPAGIYTTCSPTEVRYIINHADAPVVFLESEEQWEKIEAILRAHEAGEPAPEGEESGLPRLQHVVMMRGVAPIQHPLVMGWEEFVARGDEVGDDALDARLEGLKEDDPATFIYTSGTTGPPKAVMLSHRNLTFTASLAAELVGLTPDDHSLSYLPLSHIAEQVFTIHGPITAGSYISFAQSIEQLLDNLKEVQPTVLFGVPRIWEKMHAGLSAKLAAATGFKAKLVAWATGVGRAAVHQKNQGREPGGLLGLQYTLADRLLYSKVKPALGLGSARICVSGAAPIAPEVLEFFSGLDIPIYEVYGQSEDCGPTSFNIPGRTRFGTVGPALPGVEVRIAGDGEILVRGPNVFLGYFKNPEATAETLDDEGWLHSGDLGEFDSDGFLKITGRKKEIIITAGGKNIAPKNIEAALKNLPLVSQAVVIGDRRKFLSALLTLDPEASAAFAQDKGLSGDNLHENPLVIQAIQEGIDAEVNPQFARVEHVRKFKLLHRDFSVDDNDRGKAELTPTLKIKRRIVNTNFSDEIESIYAEA
jgi:long-chain acyl-CoA synthetase